MKKKDLWFAAKKYGYGWYPSTWQGWTVLGVYLAYEIFLSLFIGKSFDSRAGVSSFLFLSLLGTILLIVICYKKGEPARWRWGK